MKILLLVTFVVFCQFQNVESATNCTGTRSCVGIRTCMRIINCTDGYIQPANADCNCCAFCQKFIGLGEKCYSQYGTELKCKQGLSCSTTTKTCQHSNICDSTLCAMYIPVCKNGTINLPRDPSKCRCCGNRCGHHLNETGCQPWQKCNPVTGVCSNVTTGHEDDKDGDGESAAKCDGARNCFETRTCMKISNCTDGYVQPANTDCNCCAFCQKYIGLGKNCHSQYGTELKCKRGLSCSPSTKTCQPTNICDSMRCRVYIIRPICKNGTINLPQDPSKCRCCNDECGHDLDETGCEPWQKCNRVTGVCSNSTGHDRGNRGDD